MENFKQIKIKTTSVLQTYATRLRSFRWNARMYLVFTIIFGAAMVKLPHVTADPSALGVNFMAGVLTPCLIGIASIGFLVRYVQTKDFLPFVWYRFILGGVVIVATVARW